MAEITKNFVSLVALGSPNPQILTVDFLKANNILPQNEPPFDKLLQQEKPFTNFISTPVMSRLVMENIELMVDQGRFQIRNTVVSEWTDTKILDIAKKYFAVLEYTPLKVVGMNLNATITFGAPEEAVNFQRLFLSENGKLADIIPKENVTAGLVLSYPYTDNHGHIMLTLGRPNEPSGGRKVNLNYEFDFTDWAKFRTELEKISEIGEYFDFILGELLKGA